MILPTAWTPYAGNPILSIPQSWETVPPGMVEGGGISWNAYAPGLLVDNYGRPIPDNYGYLYRIWWGALTPTGDCIGTGYGNDGYNFLKYAGNPVLQKSSNYWENLHVNDPAVQKVGDTYFMIYGTSYADAIHGCLGITTFTDCNGPYTRYSSPVIPVYEVGGFYYSPQRGSMIYDGGTLRVWYPVLKWIPAGGVGCSCIPINTAPHNEWQPMHYGTINPSTLAYTHVGTLPDMILDEPSVRRFDSTHLIMAAMNGLAIDAYMCEDDGSNVGQVQGWSKFGTNIMSPLTAYGSPELVRITDGGEERMRLVFSRWLTAHPFVPPYEAGIYVIAVEVGDSNVICWDCSVDLEVLSLQSSMLALENVGTWGVDIDLTQMFDQSPVDGDSVNFIMVQQTSTPAWNAVNWDLGSGMLFPQFVLRTDWIHEPFANCFDCAVSLQDLLLIIQPSIYSPPNGDKINFTLELYSPAEWDEVNWFWPSHLILNINSFNIDTVFEILEEILPGNPYLYKKMGLASVKLVLVAVGII